MDLDAPIYLEATKAWTKMPPPAVTSTGPSQASAWAADVSPSPCAGSLAGWRAHACGRLLAMLRL